MKQFINIPNKEIKLLIKGFDDYVVADKKVFNIKTGRELKPKLKNGIIGYNLKGKFTPYKKIEFERPKTFDCPF